MLSDLVIFTLAGVLFSHAKINLEKAAPFYMFRSFWIGLAFSALYAIIVYWYQGPEVLLWAADDSTMPSGFSPEVKQAIHIFVSYLIGYLLGSHGRMYSWLMLTGVYLGTGWIFYEHIRQNPYEYEKLFPFLLGFLGVWIASMRVSYVNKQKYYEQGKIIAQLFHPGKQRTMQALAEVILPPAPDLRPISGKDLPLGREYSTFLANANITQRIAHRVLTDVLLWSPLFTSGIPRRLTKLPRQKQEEILQKVENSKNFYIKISLSVIKMYLYQFYYGHPEVMDHFQYQPGCRGEYRKKKTWQSAPQSRGVLYGTDI